ncbi:hypothetical protein AC579_2998 [Pseudocercospora musae]|uniref:Uncharacterized protein n=1 Tax=Pseudocercospora musae TaxID=113226 RepID=A0A139I551_9PEZI|nr:hypothetical protein AC579_2998 [Pseudocercospora musae]
MNSTRCLLSGQLQQRVKSEIRWLLAAYHLPPETSTFECAHGLHPRASSASIDRGCPSSCSIHVPTPRCVLPLFIPIIDTLRTSNLASLERSSEATTEPGYDVSESMSRRHIFLQLCYWTTSYPWRQVGGHLEARYLAQTPDKFRTVGTQHYHGSFQCEAMLSAREMTRRNRLV